MDQSGGCPPLTIFFTNTTQASAGAVYQWDFGNGNTSSKKDPGAVFLEPATYSVTLKVTDNNQVSTSIQTVHVYKKPVVDFNVSAQKVCTPDPVNFTASATADQGSIAQYNWDFGDGTTQISYGPQVSHIYLSGQQPSVTLSVRDNHGCTDSKIINGIIEVKPGAKASFDADKTFICFETDPVTLVNHSTGEGHLSYTWDFGDGVSSIETNPVHSFNKKGIYSVQLQVQSENGCKSTLSKSAYLNVGSFQSGMSVASEVCLNESAEFKNVSQPAPTSFNWLIDGSQGVYQYNGKYTYNFGTAGEHTVQLTNHFGGCKETISKKIVVHELPQPKGFVAEIPDYCFTPVTVNFKDTTSGIIRSEWGFDYYEPTLTGKSVQHSFSYAGSHYARLWVTDANGCSNSISKTVEITEPLVSIQATDYGSNTGCENLTKKFKINSNVPLLSTVWNFGDGTSSAEADPEHTFGVGNFSVSLTYTTEKGCKAVSNQINIQVSAKPKADFSSLSGTTICGNASVVFQATNLSNNYYNNWYINGTYAGSSGDSKLYYNFDDTGTYSITLIQTAQGTGCSDTRTRTDYIKVLPSFSRITQVANSCENDRGLVTLTQHSPYAEKWTWNFGDGNLMVLTRDTPSVTHHYSTSGSYQVTLTTETGSCTSLSSAEINVLKKENIVLTAQNASLCMDEPLAFTLSGFTPNVNNYMTYYLVGYQYENNSTTSDYQWIQQTPFSGHFSNIDKSRDSIRMITQNAAFNCFDTTNFIPIVIKGAKAGFEITSNKVCFQDPVVFRDTSTALNTSILSRVWNFGDGQNQSTTSGGVVYHKYANPGDYYVTLSITDTSNCTSTTPYYSYSQMAVVNGPKAQFYPSQTDAHLNSNIQFYNNTNNNNNYNTQYQWDFGDGVTATDYSPSHTYTKAGNFSIRLVAINTESGCTDTAYQAITVRNFNANFSFSTSLIDAIQCVPVLVRFTNTSQDFTHIKWDFGDGYTSEELNYPSHIYTKPGKYYIRLFVTGHNGLSNTYLDSIVVKDNQVNITVDQSKRCVSQSITLSVTGGEAASYLWDFGDGNLVQASDTFSVHSYKDPGMYIPKLVAKDDEGCAASVTLKNKIAIDSLSLSLEKVPSKICTPKEVLFEPAIISISPDQAQGALSYHWDFGTGIKKDTSDISTPVFEYQQPGNYKVSLQVRSPYGCFSEKKVDIAALQGLGVQINGPAAICQESTAQFSGATLLPGQPTWQWTFDDGTVSDQQTAPLKKFDTPGNFQVQLIVDNKGCSDTLTKRLIVHAKPIVGIPVSQPVVCEGSSITLKATGGLSYHWSPSAGLSQTTGASVNASPLVSTLYAVTATNSFGCSNRDSVRISVIHPFTLQLDEKATICSGKSANIEASGAVAYQWIENTEGLSSTTIPNPVAAPLKTAVFTVVGKGEYDCFTDTASIRVTVNPSPVVDAGMGGEVLAGTPFQLQPSASNDVIKWNWTPGNYLSCQDCPSPKVTPLKPMNYTLTVTNGAGCISSDTLSVKLLCGEGRIYIPNAFTPNGDRLNDRFSITGQGITTLNHLRIFDSWGNLIFERAHLSIGDPNASWDGKYKGNPVPMGTYVYIIEMSCNEKVFSQKGSVTVLY